jgi:methionine sulfoxide reductase catalytic subunit
VAENDLPMGSSDAGHQTVGAEKHIGRRAFLALMAAGVVALVFGRDVFARLSGTPSAGAFNINSVTPSPEFDPQTWRIKVDGLVGTPLEFSFAQFTGLPQVKRTRDFYCVEGWGVDNVEWTGVRVAELTKRAGLDPSATHLVFHSGDGVYTDSLTLAEAAEDDIILAHHMNGELLSPDHGLPVRLIVPKQYGYKYVKWVVRVEAIAAGSAGYSGYWEDRGYPADAPIR